MTSIECHYQELPDTIAKLRQQGKRAREIKVVENGYIITVSPEAAQDELDLVTTLGTQSNVPISNPGRQENR